MIFDILTPEEVDKKYTVNDPWDYVTHFEHVIAGYCGYKHGIACDSNTNAIKLCLEWWGKKDQVIKIPDQTYVSVANQIILSGNHVKFDPIYYWDGDYHIAGTPIIDSACLFEKDCDKKYDDDHYRILSFHHRKIVNIGRGGMILTNDGRFESWARHMIYDGRNKNTPYGGDKILTIGYHMYMRPEEAKTGLEILHSGRIDKPRMTCGSHNDYPPLSEQPIFNSEEITSHIVTQWNLPYLESELYNIALKTPKTHIVVALPQEPIPYLNTDIERLYTLDSMLGQINKKITFYTGCELREDITQRLENIKLIEWDGIDYFAKASPYRHPSLVFQGEHHTYNTFELLKYIIPSRHFSIMTLVKRGRIWRGFVVDKFFECGLKDRTHVCVRVNPLAIGFNGSYLIENNSLKQEIKFKPTSWTTSMDIPYKSSDIIDFHRNKTPPEYMMGAIDVVLETINDSFFVTEKTIRPIMSEKPFLVFSCKDFHKKLVEKYGFKLYDNLFDYSFDSIEDPMERFTQQIKVLKDVSDKFSPEQIFNLTRDVAHHNNHVLEDIRNSGRPRNVPKYLYERIKKFNYNDW